MNVNNIMKDNQNNMGYDKTLCPLVTVVLPVYNRPEVTKTIDSILRQTYSNFELLIIDNASTDDTITKIKGYSDRRIKLYINEVNRGQTFSLNRGLDLANGKYIARIDSDDLMMPNRLEKQVRYMEENASCSICGSNVQIIDDNDLLVENHLYVANDEDIRLLASIYCPFAHPAVLMRTEDLRRNNIKYDSNYCMAEDYDMWIRILKYGKGYNIQECLTKYRVGKHNDSVKYHNQMKDEGLLVRQYIAENFELKNCTKKEYLELLEMAKKINKNCLEVLKTVYFWNKYLNKADCNDYSRSIIKSRLTIFMCESCFEGNERISVQIVYSILRFIKKSIKYLNTEK